MMLFYISELVCICVVFFKRQTEITKEIKDLTGEGGVIQDSAFGYRPAPFARGEETLYLKDSIIARAHYISDNLGRRITPYENSGRYFAAFFGCSFTYGQLRDSTETIPYYFSRFDSLAQPFNYAFNGYGAQQPYLWLKSPDFKKTLALDSGVAFYIFIDQHVNRTIGSQQVYTSWGADLPYFYLDHDILVQKGSFRTGRKALSLLYTILHRSYTWQVLGIDLPLQLRDKHYRLTARLIAEAAFRFEKYFPGSKYYAVLYPGSSQNIISYLKEYNIQYLDYTNLFDYKDKKYNMLPYDGHPSALANRILAQKLAKDIALTH